MLDMGLRRLDTPFETASMEDLATASGLPRSSLYYRFANKDEVLEFLADGMIGRLAAAVALAYEASPRALSRVAALVEAHLQHFADCPGVAQLLLVQFARLGDLLDVSQRIEEAFHRPVAELLREANVDGHPQLADPELASEALYGALTGVALSRIVRDGEVDVHDVSARLMQVFGLAGATSRPVPSSRPR